MRILTTFIDSGGHCKDAVYRECAMRTARRVFAIKGKGGEDEEYVKMSSEMKRKKGIMLFIVGVDSGKEKIAYSLNVKEAGPWYSHFPAAPEAGYTPVSYTHLDVYKRQARPNSGFKDFKRILEDCVKRKCSMRWR